jgi:hypothetical protein
VLALILLFAGGWGSFALTLVALAGVSVLILVGMVAAAWVIGLALRTSRDRRI